VPCCAWPGTQCVETKVHTNVQQQRKINAQVHDQPQNCCNEAAAARTIMHMHAKLHFKLTLFQSAEAAASVVPLALHVVVGRHTPTQPWLASLIEPALCMWLQARWHVYQWIYLTTGSRVGKPQRRLVHLAAIAVAAAALKHVQHREQQQHQDTLQDSRQQLQGSRGKAPVCFELIGPMRLKAQWMEPGSRRK